MEESIYELVKLMPENQEVDNDTHVHFVHSLSLKIRRYSNYTTSWSDSLFTQFYESYLIKKDISTVTKEAKDYINYFISHFLHQIRPCFQYIDKQEIHCSYKEVKNILEDVFRLDKALELISSLRQFGQVNEANEAVFIGIYEVYCNVHYSDFYQNLQKHLCSIEIERIEQKYNHRHLPILPSTIEPLNASIIMLENTYDFALNNGSTQLTNSVRMKIVPIINELVVYVHNNFEDEAIVKKVILAINQMTEQFRKATLKQKEDDTKLQLEIDLELLKQISDNL